MNPSSSDNTLDIKPMPSGNMGGWSRPVKSTISGQANSDAIEQARLTIANIGSPTPAFSPSAAPAPVAALPIPQPVSPASDQLMARRKQRYSRIGPIFTALASFLLILALFKAPVLYTQIRYLTSSHPTDQITPITNSAATETVPPNPLITIPKINVSAPLVFEPSFDETKVQKALEGGVVHYGSTPNPGQTGNSVFVGHSSNDWWEAGNYKFIFVLLDKLVPGDSFSINFQSKRYIYEVTEAKVVEANDLGVLAPTADPTVTLITCWPAGTSLKREIIKAKQISPEPSASATAVTPTARPTGSLPGSAASLITQIKDFWQRFQDGFTNKPTTVTAPDTTTGSGSPALPGAR